MGPKVVKTDKYEMIWSSLLPSDSKRLIVTDYLTEEQYVAATKMIDAMAAARAVGIDAPIFTICRLV